MISHWQCIHISPHSSESLTYLEGVERAVCTDSAVGAAILVYSKEKKIQIFFPLPHVLTTLIRICRFSGFTYFISVVIIICEGDKLKSPPPAAHHKPSNTTALSNEVSINRTEYIGKTALAMAKTAPEKILTGEKYHMQENCLPLLRNC